jgi:uncharacterized iron-regulated membrane protein
MTAKTLHRWTIVHRWTSLFVTLNLTLLCITGLYLIFHHEIDHARGIDPVIEGTDQPRLALGEIVKAAQLEKDGWRPMSYAEDEEHPGLVFISMCPPGVNDFSKAKPFLFNAHTGKLADLNLDETFSMWVLKLHINLFGGIIGELYLALVGLALLVAILSGVLIYAPFMRGVRFGELRKSRSKRVYRLDLHNLIGIATLAWLSVVTITGVILELAKPILAIYQAKDLAAMTADYRHLPKPESTVPLDAAVAAAELAWPEHHVRFALFPGTPYSGEHHYTFFMGQGEGTGKRVPKLALIDASDASVTVAREAPLYIKALFVSGPLHFGDYAGMPLKIIWALFTLLTLVLCFSGIYLTWARIRSRSQTSKTSS